MKLENRPCSCLDIIIFNVPSRPGSRFLNNDSKTNRGRTYPPSQDLYTSQVNCEKISAQILSGVRTEILPAYQQEINKLYSAPNGDTSFPRSMYPKRQITLQGHQQLTATSVRRRTSYAEGDRAHGLRPN